MTRAVAALGCGAVALAVVAGTPVRPEGPPLAHTGGFGEPTCRACHSDGAPAGAPDGALTIGGLPDRFEPGRTYDVVLTLERPGLARAGFEMAIRFAPHAASAARQAGALATSDTARIAVERDSSTGVVYAHHTLGGTVPAAEGSARWVVRWLAPPNGEAVVVHAAAVAANDDNSNFGDEVYARALVVRAGP